MCSFLLECGRTTFGPLADIVPGHQDIYFRRFAVGFQLAWLLLAGNGLVALGRAVTRLVRAGASRAPAPDEQPVREERTVSEEQRAREERPAPEEQRAREERPAPEEQRAREERPVPRSRRRPAMACRWAIAVMIVAAVASGLGAVVARVTSLDSENGNAIAYQALADRTQGAEVDSLVEVMKSIGPGRVYAGTVLNWGSRFRVGGIPVYKYLETQSVDVMVYSATTTTLMDDPEFSFNERVPGDYALFGVSYLLLPTWMQPLVPAELVGTQSIYSLWKVDGVGYATVVDTVGSLEEDRADIGPVSRGYLDSSLPGLGLYLTVGYEGQPAAEPTDPGAASEASAGAPGTGIPGTGIPSPAGSIVSQTDDLADGNVQLKVDMSRRAVVALSVTYDPGWTVWVDGRRAMTEMLVPALLGVTVGPGTHTVKFAYVGFPYYDLLFTVGASLVVLPAIWFGVVVRRKRRDSGTAQPSTAV